MKFKKVQNSYYFSKYVREDGKFTIEATDRKNENGTWKPVFVVTDSAGREVEVMKRLKDAKEKYSEA